MRMTVPRARLVLPLVLLFGSCRNGSPDFPETPLGRVGHDWLAAHNRAEGHAAVHFTLLNRGSAAMSGAQVDSAVRDQVRFAQRVGRLVPVRLLYSSDTAVIMLLHSADDSLWSARFTRVPQPGLAKVDVDVRRASMARGAKVVMYPDPNTSRQ
jgi:hypothetical protein